MPSTEENVFRRLRHPGWGLFVIPVILGAIATLTPRIVRIFLLTAGVVGFAWIFHRTDYCGRRLKVTLLATGLVCLIAFGIYRFGELSDASQRKQVIGLDPARPDMPAQLVPKASPKSSEVTPERPNQKTEGDNSPIVNGNGNNFNFGNRAPSKKKGNRE